MTRRFIDMSLKKCAFIKNDRTVSSVMEHLKGEVLELEDEVAKYINNEPSGDDGILGEAVDVMICAMDLVYLKNPSVSSEYVFSVVEKKLAKWERLYHHPMQKELFPEPVAN